MGAWGIGAFDNDNAMDWAVQLFESDDESMLVEAFELALGELEYLEVDVGNPAIAAAEIVAALHGAPGATLPDRVAQWVAEHPLPANPTLASLAREALARAADPDVSETAELWQETADFDRWRASVANLQGRLDEL